MNPPAPRLPSSVLRPLASGFWLLASSLCSLLFALCPASPLGAGELRVGIQRIDITPTNLPVRVNGMFIERQATNVADRLHARCFVLQKDETRIALVVVDTCMMTRDLIDAAKADAQQRTGIPVSRMLISATHTHSAPSVTGCLGSRVDPAYAAFLPGKIAEGIAAAAKSLQPARAGWISVDDWSHTFCRRWIRRPDRMLTDPFGQMNVRAHMHPGYESPDAIGPSGPVDPGLSLLAFQSLDGKPIAVLANYSQHYYGSDLVSSDYFGRFARHFAELAGVDAEDPSFLVAMSQGTSGDQMWMDYGAPKREIGYDAYAREMAQAAAQAWRKITYHDIPDVAMEETLLDLGFRVPDATRLSWARELAQKLGDRLPATQPEIYALEALALHARPRAELKIQALRIGELGIVAIPNEVFGITGLKIKSRSPLAQTFNIELANGAEGYIPPPEQHVLGGYTTWPARTAGLEPQAEPRIVETALALLEKVSGKKQKQPTPSQGRYPAAILRLKPSAYWRLDEWSGTDAKEINGGVAAALQGPIAFQLPGPDSNYRADGHPSEPPRVPNPFSDSQRNAAVHLAGGLIRANLPNPADSFSTVFWFWNGLPADARATNAILFSASSEGGRSITTGIAGSGDGKLFVESGTARTMGLKKVALKAWHQLAVVADPAGLKIFLDGREEFALRAAQARGRWTFSWGGATVGGSNLEGKLDEIALWNHPIRDDLIIELWKAGGYPDARPISNNAVTEIFPAALSPAESLSRLHVRPGFTAELIASEPQIESPVAIDWDASGRLWVVEMIDYPLGLDGKGQPGGRIRILEDRDGDGRYESSRIFAEGLRFPTGLLTWRKGVLVTAAPEILYLEDTNGDGVADRKEVLITGFPESNQQLRVNGLRWGLDNWIYCANGSPNPSYGHATKIRSAKTGVELVLGSRDFRFNPATGEIDPLSGPSQFGRNRNEWGDWFGVQNSWPLWHYVLEDSYLRLNPHLAVDSTRHQLVGPANPRVFPAAAIHEKRFHSFEHAGHFTSACSAMIYRDRLLFGQSDASHAFTCEPFHNLVQHAVVHDDGVTFSATRDPAEPQSEILASEDRWFRPVMVRDGPDGGLWVVDMYRYMIEHPDWLPENGKQELLSDYRAGDDLGRIYRIRPTQRAVRNIPNLETMADRELIRMLGHVSGWVRDKAQQLLLERNAAGQERALQSLLRSLSPLDRLHALWTLDGLKLLKPADIRRALSDSHPGIRRNALRLAEKYPSVAILDLAQDPDPKVRLQLALCAAHNSGADKPKVAEALARMAQKEPNEPFLRDAILISCASNTFLLSALTAAHLPAYEPALWPMAISLKNREAISNLLQPAAPGSSTSIEPMKRLTTFLQLLAERRQKLEDWTAEPDQLGRLLTETHQRFDQAAQMLDASTAPEAQKLAALELLQNNSERQALVVATAQKWLGAGQPVALQQAAVQTLAKTGKPEVATLLVHAWPAATPQLRSLILDQLLARENWTLIALQAVERQEVPASALDTARRARLLQHSSPAIRELAAKIMGATSSSSRQAVIEKYRPALALRGDPDKGRAVYQRVCSNCHRLGETGGEIGPNLISVNEHPPEKLLVSILDPNAMIEPGYLAYECGLANDEELYGMIAGETTTSIVFKTTDGKSRTLLRNQIRKLRATQLSLMPEGLEETLSPQDLADLIAALRAKPARVAR